MKKNNQREPVLKRKVGFKTEREYILIVCEGKQTEPSYFKQFKLANVNVKIVGEGFNTVSLVKRTTEILETDRHHYDQIWCVFDKDDFKNSDFDNAIQLAESLGFRVAYSNQSFEYWLILHLDDHQGGGMHRKYYHDRINALLLPHKVVYDGRKGKVITKDFFNLLNAMEPKTGKTRVEIAIERAARLLQQHSNSPPSKAESSTTVHLLVAQLLKYQ